MNLIKTIFKELKYFLILWLTQALSQLGSSMTNYALIVWSYTSNGSALTTALLSVCSYAPYVIISGIKKVQCLSVILLPLCVQFQFLFC